MEVLHSVNPGRRFQGSLYRVMALTALRRRQSAPWEERANLFIPVSPHMNRSEQFGHGVDHFRPGDSTDQLAML